MKSDTIFAPSSGNGPSGVAIIRISGPETSFIIKSLTNKALLIDFGLSLNLNKIIKKKDLYGNIKEID